MTAPVFRSSSGRAELYASPLGPRLVLWGDGVWIAEYLDPDDAHRFALALTNLVDNPTAAAAIGAAAAVVDADPYPYLLSVPELADVPLDRCEDCGKSVRRGWIHPAWDHVADRTVWVGPGCARKRMRAAAARAGVQLAITSNQHGGDRRG